MKLIIAGSRTLKFDAHDINNILSLHYLYDVTEIVSGTAQGIDQAGEDFFNKTQIFYFDYPTAQPCKLTKFPADWDKYGKGAGHIRNAEMAKYGDALLLIWDGSSRGSANMKQQMEKLGKPVYEVIIKVPKVSSDDL